MAKPELFARPDALEWSDAQKLETDALLVGLSSDLKIIAVGQKENSIWFLANDQADQPAKLTVGNTIVTRTNPDPSGPRPTSLSVTKDRAIVGFENGNLKLYNVKQPEEHLALEPGTVPPVAIDFLPEQRQVIVARADSSVDIYYLHDKSLNKLTTFQLAHEHLHSIITYPGQARYIIAGLAKDASADSKADGQTNPGKAPTTLIAICNARPEVLAVFPILDEDKAPPSKPSFITQVNSFTLSGDSKTSEEETDRNRLTEGELSEIQDALNTTTLRAELTDLASGVLRLNLTVPQWNFERLSLKDCREVKVNAAKYYLHIGITLTRFKFEKDKPLEDMTVTDFWRTVSQEMIEVNPPGTSCGEGELVIQVKHPMLKHEDIWFPHNAKVELAYELSSSDQGETVRFEAKPVECRFQKERDYEQFRNIDDPLINNNPFLGETRPVCGDKFFARGDEVRKLINNVVGGEHTTIEGARRSGKSSVISEFEHRLRNRQEVLVVKFEADRKHRDDISLFARKIVENIPLALDNKKLSGFDPASVLPASVLSAGNGEETAVQWLITAAELLHAQQKIETIVVMIDEWGDMYREFDGQKAMPASKRAELFGIPPHLYEPMHEFNKQFRSIQTNLTSRGDRYRFVLAGLPWHFQEIGTSGRGSGLYGYISARSPVPPVGDKDIEDMLTTKLRNARLGIDEKALTQCLELSSGVMHDANMIMNSACKLLADEKGETIGETHLRNAKSALVDHYRRVIIKGVWEDIEKYAENERVGCENIKVWLERESCKDHPIWEEENITIANSKLYGVDVRPLIEMGFRKPDWESLLIPRGLALCIREGGLATVPAIEAVPKTEPPANATEQNGAKNKPKKNTAKPQQSAGAKPRSR